MTIHAWLRYAVISRLIPDAVDSVLEIGAGKGSVGALLSRRFRYVGLEPDPESYASATERVGDRGMVLREREESFSPESQFDMVCAFEVLEHLEHDRDALVRWQRHVKPGGWTLVSVPAGRDRFRSSDVKVGHYRRYDRSDFEQVLNSAGLSEIEILTYGFPIGYALEAARNLIARWAYHSPSLEERTAGSGRWLQAPAWSAGLFRAAATPFMLMQRPFMGGDLGTGLVARARRPVA